MVIILSDKRYSIDDILNEYASTDYVDNRSKDNESANVNIDELLKSYDTDTKAMSSVEKLENTLDDVRISLNNTDLFPKTNINVINEKTHNENTVKQDIANKSSDVPSKPDKPEKNSDKNSEKGLFKNKARKINTDADPFQQKYKDLTTPLGSDKNKSVKDDYIQKQSEQVKNTTETKSKGRSFSDKFEMGANYSKNSDKSRSFSDKFEMDNVYSDISEDSDKTDKLKRAGLFSGSAKKGKTVPDNNDISREIQSENTDKNNNAKSNPFDKYSSIEDKNIDDILNEYTDINDKRDSRISSSHHKNFTDIFTKLIPKPVSPSEAEMENNSGLQSNTELLDGMIRIKKERKSRTAVIPAIERKSISDIDLKLDDKIIPNTAPIPLDAEHTEIEKFNELKERRNKKIKDFVLVGDEEESFEDDTDGGDNKPRVIEDFESFEDAPAISHDIVQLKGSLMMRLFVVAFCLILSLYIAIANDVKALPIIDILNKRTQTNAFLFVNTVIGLLAAFSSYTVISSGLSKLLAMKSDCDTLAAVSITSSIALSMVMFADTNMIKGSQVQIYIPVAIATLLFNTIGKLLIVNRTQRSFKFVSGASEKYAIFPITDEEKAHNFTRGAIRDLPSLAGMRKTEFLSEFLKTSYSSDASDRFSRLFAPICLGAGLLIGVIAGILAYLEYGTSGIYVGISVFTACVSICAGFSIMLVVNFPMSKASKKHIEMQGVVLGNEAVDEFSETNSVLVDAKELFPQGSVNLSAIKVFSDTRIDEAIVEAASLTSQSGSILKNMFYDIIAGKTELLNPVESYIYEDSMGLCGWINNKRVLLGNRELMINHSIEGVPTEAKEKEYTENRKAAVYLSISGELSAMFVVDLTPSLEIKNALNELQKNDVYVIIRSVDSIVTINRLSDMFHISPDIFKLIPFRLHTDFDDFTTYQPKQRATLACSGRFSVMSALILSCKRIKNTINLGIGIQAISMLLGLLICLAMVILKSFTELSVSMITLYCTAFTAVLLMIQSFRKN